MNGRAPLPLRVLGRLIGLAITNAGMNMTPTGGMSNIIGNNPFAMAVPTTREWPMVLDMATSVVAGGKLDVLFRLEIVGIRCRDRDQPIIFANGKDLETLCQLLWNQPDRMTIRLLQVGGLQADRRRKSDSKLGR